jgi:uncharacterized protein
MMELYTIPVEDKFILYRPLRRLALVGNQALVDLALALTRRHNAGAGGGAWVHSSAASVEAADLMAENGFLDPDPPAPLPPGAAYRPTTAVLLLSSRCNLRCTYCYANGGEAPVQDLSMEVARPVIDEVCRCAAEQGQSRFELTFHGGGEPLQAWDTMQAAVAYARGLDLPCHVSMVSNGVCTRGQRAWLLDNLDSLSISFDGRPETQDRQRPFASGHPSCHAVLRTLAALDGAGFSYGIRMTATAPWRGQLAGDVRFICEETGCQVIQVEPAFNTRRGRHRGPAIEESHAFVDGFMEAFEIASQSGRKLAYSGARPWALTQAFCTAPYGALVVNPAGSLVACYEVADSNHPLAAVSTLGRVQDGRVVHDEQARRALWSYLEEKRAGCRDCFCYWHCAGDCYTRSFAAAAGPERSNPRCLMNREITARILLWYIMQGDGMWRGQVEQRQVAHLMRQF